MDDSKTKDVGLISVWPDAELEQKMLSDADHAYATGVSEGVLHHFFHFIIISELSSSGVAVQRSAKVTLKFTTAAKRKKLAALLRRYRSAVNFFIKRLWNNIDTTYHDLDDGLLSARYRSAALRQAENIVSSTRKASAATGHAAGQPHFHGGAVLDAKFVAIEVGKGHFDIAVRISSLVNGERIVVLTKSTRVLNKWLSMPGATLVQGCNLDDDYLTLWVTIPDQDVKEEGDVIAVDVGINKVLVDSEGTVYGDKFKDISAKIRRRMPGSNGRRRANIERDQYLNWCVNQLPWGRIKVVGHERLKNLKKGKQKNRGKSFRKALAPWRYCQVLAKVDRKALESRALTVEYNPRHTSQRCPDCGTVSRLNRDGESFKCIRCGRADDADFIGALNGLACTSQILASVESARLQEVNETALK